MEPEEEGRERGSGVEEVEEKEEVGAMREERDFFLRALRLLLGLGEGEEEVGLREVKEGDFGCSPSSFPSSPSASSSPSPPADVERAGEETAI